MPIEGRNLKSSPGILDTLRDTSEVQKECVDFAQQLSQIICFSMSEDHPRNEAPDPHDLQSLAGYLCSQAHEIRSLLQTCFSCLRG